MLSKINFKKHIFGINTSNFNEMAVNLFQFQAIHNPVYHRYLHLLGVSPGDVRFIEDIPFMPIGFFKSQKVTTGDEAPQAIFKSSGTSKQARSQHYVPDLDFYTHISIRIFEIKYGKLSDFIILALLPSYLENQDSSLIQMVNKFIERSGHPSSSFISINSGTFVKQVYENRGAKKILLLGVTYALLQFAMQNQIAVPEAMIMETGGMKGRGVERPREEVHILLKKYFQVNTIHSEYGMTEMLSQSYAAYGGNFEIPFTMRVFTREMNDPLSLNDQKTIGPLNIVDLANIDSCAFLATEDIGRLNGDGTFIVSGRIDNSEIRGCNLLSVG